MMWTFGKSVISVTEDRLYKDTFISYSKDSQAQGTARTEIWSNMTSSRNYRVNRSNSMPSNIIR